MSDPTPGEQGGRAEPLLARAEAIFHRVMEMPVEERIGAARNLCAGDADLRDEVESLVRAAAVSDFLSTPALDVRELWAVAQSGEGPDPLQGKRFDEYQVLERIGSGGMGVVYRARQEHPSREVALKVLRPGILSAESVRRFENEAQILAHLEHPGIAQVHRAGRLRTEAGTQPYFVMELVRGLPLLEFLEKHELSVSQRLELLARICDAVQHAHAKGVVHRDLKPANILIVARESPGDGLGWQPKVLDFGVARLADPETALSIAATSRTTAGEIVGTLAYMSPEQLAAPPGAQAGVRQGGGGGREALLDTRADVYALGVILYQLLSGKLPIDLSGSTIAQAAPRIVSEEPPRLGLLNRAFRGDIEIIAEKALHKDREQRYQTAAALAEDLRRAAAHAPILARPPSAGYQIRKFARRNRVLVGGAGLALLLLIAGIIGTSVGLVRARTALKLAEQREREAREALLQAERSTTFLTSMLASANPTASRGRQITVLELVDLTAARVGFDLADMPRVEGRTRIALARTYLSLFAVSKASAEAERALTLAASAFGPRSIEYSEALAGKASILIADGKHAQAEQLCRDVLEMRLEALGADAVEVAHARVLLGRALANGMKVDEAEREFSQAEPVLAKGGDREFAVCVTTHADTILRRPPRENRLPDAQNLLQAALESLQPRGVAADPDRATVLMSLGAVHMRLKQPRQAEESFVRAAAIRDKIFPATHPAALSVRLRVVTAIRDQGRLEEAKDLAVKLLEDSRRSLTEGSGELSNTLVMTADLFTRLKDHASATPLLEDNARIAKGGGDEVIGLVAIQLLGQNYLETRRYADAERIFREAVAKLDAPGRRVSSAASYRGHLADALGGQGRHEEAAQILEKGLELISMITDQAGLKADLLRRMGREKAALGDATAAQQVLREAVQMYRAMRLETEAGATQAELDRLNDAGS